MSAEKADYPHRPHRRGRPKSSNNGGGKRRSWTSSGTKNDGRKDTSPRENVAWYDAPIYKQARIRKWKDMPRVKPRSAELVGQAEDFFGFVVEGG